MKLVTYGCDVGLVMLSVYPYIVYCKVLLLLPLHSSLPSWGRVGIP